MKTRILRLVTGHSSWWKKKKYRTESFKELNGLRKLGWRLKKKKKFFLNLMILKQGVSISITCLKNN